MLCTMLNILTFSLLSVHLAWLYLRILIFSHLRGNLESLIKLNIHVFEEHPNSTQKGSQLDWTGDPLSVTLKTFNNQEGNQWCSNNLNIKWRHSHSHIEASLEGRIQNVRKNFQAVVLRTMESQTAWAEVKISGGGGVCIDSPSWPLSATSFT